MKKFVPVYQTVALSGESDNFCFVCNHKNISDLHRGIYQFKRGYQPINNLAKDDSCDLLADSHSIFNASVRY
jgi:hypothetical protein